MKSILITGANGGMGRAATELLLKEGYRVFALDLNPCEENDNLVPIVADIRDEASIRLAFEKIAEYTDSLYAVLHFAGLYMLDSMVEMPTEEFDKIVDVNFRGTFLINKHAVPFMKKGSRIIITTSELAPLDPLPFTGIYAVTKAALDKYAYSLAMELQLLGIKVSVLRAGAVKTDMLGASTDALDRFCEKTKLYSCNAKRFKAIVDSVESKCISAERIARKTSKIISKKSPKFAYAINRNPLLRLLSVLPKRLQLFVIRKILASG